MDIGTTLNQDHQPRDGPIILFHVTGKQQSPLHQGHRFMPLCAFFGIVDNIQYNRFLSDVVDLFRARS